MKIVTRNEIGGSEAGGSTHGTRKISRGMAGGVSGMAGVNRLPGKLIREPKLRLILEMSRRWIGRRARI